MTKREKIAWAAGFVDGEGCIQIVRNRHNAMAGEYQYKVSLTVVQKAKSPLTKLVEIFGGEVKKHDGYWRWTVMCAQADSVLRALLPFLVLKKSQAELALSFQSRRGTIRRNGRITANPRQKRQDEKDYEQMRNLKVYY
jgi:hypothetical protein